MQHIFNNTFGMYKNQLSDFINHFDYKGELFGNAERNTIKLITIKDLKINVKSFKTPNIFNQIVYKFFRKSKAQRSFEYANILIDLGVCTPQPIAYYTFKTPLLFKKSFYISEHLSYDLTYRELTLDLEFPNHENILRAFTRFTFKLHELDIHFLDHSPGNTLIKKLGNTYNFYLVDLNRMDFKPLDFKTRIRNFERLTIHKSMVKIMSDEYAKCTGYDFDNVFDLMWKNTQDFQAKFWRRRRLKEKLKFWKK